MKDRIIKLVIGLAIFGLLVWKFDINQILDDLYHSDPVYILLALALTPFTMHIRAIRLQEILLIHGEKISLFALNRLCYMGFLFGVITPSRTGDFIRVYYLTKENKVSYSHSMGSIFIDRILDVIALFVLVDLAMIYFPYFLGRDVFRDVVWLPILATLFLVILLYLLTREWFLEKMLNFLRRAFRKILKKHRHTYAKNIEEISGEFHTTLRNLKNNKKKFLPIMIINVILWFFILLQAQLILVALGENVDMAFTFLAIPFAILAALLPVTLSGVGTRDAAMVVLFSLVGVPASKAISLAILFLFMGQLVPAVIGWYFYLTRGHRDHSSKG